MNVRTRVLFASVVVGTMLLLTQLGGAIDAVHGPDADPATCLECHTNDPPGPALFVAPSGGETYLTSPIGIVWVSPGDPDGFPYEVSFDIEFERADGTLGWPSVVYGVLGEPTGVPGEFAFAWDATALAEGDYLLRIRAFDGIDYSPWVQSGVFTIDWNDPPVADAGGPYVVNEGSPVPLDGSGSSDPNEGCGDAIERWDWELDGDGDFDDTEGEVPLPIAIDHFHIDSFFDISLRVTDAFGASHTDTASVQVLNVPPEIEQLDLDFGPGSDPFEGQVASVRATFTDPGVNDIHFAVVDWGDGTVEPADVTGPNGSPGSAEATHTYADDGPFTVTVTVTDDDGGTDTESIQVTVQNVPPTVVAPSPVTTAEGVRIELRGTFTDPGMNDTHTATVDWGDGTAPEPAKVTEPNSPEGSVDATHTYADNGPYTVTLIVTDDDGGTTTCYTTVTVMNVPPTVHAGPDRTANEGEIVPIIASFVDPGTLDAPHTATIDWGDGTVEPGQVTEPNSPDGTVEGSHEYVDDGTYTATVTVTDKDGDSTSDSVEIEVKNLAPVMKFHIDLPGGDKSVPEGSWWSVSGGDQVIEIITFEDEGNDSHTATVDFGDGTPQQQATVTSRPGGSIEGTITASHRYADDGHYMVTVTVTDDEGAFDTEFFYVTVTNVAPTITSQHFDPGTEPFEGQVVAFRATFTDPGLVDTHTAVIDWGDGSPLEYAQITEPNSPEGTIEATHTYFESELYVMEVETKDDDMDVGLVMYWEVDVKNAPPVLTPPPPIQTEKGKPTPVKAEFTDPGTQDTHTGTVQWGDGTAPEPVKVTEPKSPGSVEATHTYEATGVYVVTLTVEDDEGLTDTCTVTVTVVDPNEPPVADPNGPYEIPESPTPVQLDGTGSYDPEGDPLQYSWDLDEDGIFDDAFGPMPEYRPWDDRGPVEIRLRVTDPGGLSDIGATTLSVVNSEPVIAPGTLTAPTAPVPVGMGIDTSAEFADEGVLDTHTASWNWGDGTTSDGSIIEVEGSGTAFGSHAYTSPGVYTVTLTVTDDDGGSASSAYQYAVVYDPAAGFVTGAGWIDSPPGAYAPNPTLSGRANFGFVSRYQKGATVPAGNTHFMFQAAGLSFRSTGYDWLVVAGSKAKFKGVGTLNSVAGYGFMVTATDAGKDPTQGDGFRIKIWEIASGLVVYDNKMGELDDTYSTTAIGAGNIVIHK